MRMAVIQEIKTHPMRFSKSIAVFLILFSFGLAGGLLGPTLLDLQIRVGATIEEIAYVMPARSLGIIFGSLTSGLIYTRINFQLLATIYMSISVVMIVLMPLTTNYTILLLTFVISGFVGGVGEAA